MTPPPHWTQDLLRSLVSCMEKYKTLCNYECRDFDGDLIDQYRQIPNMSASQYDMTNFGPVTAIQQTEDITNEDWQNYNTEVKSDNVLIRRGHTRVRNKIWSLRHYFWDSITQSTRSGSRKIIDKHFEALQGVWGGSPAVIKLRSAEISDIDSTIPANETEDDRAKSSTSADPPQS